MTAVASSPRPDPSAAGRAWHALAPEAALAAQAVDPNAGLSSEEAARRLTEFGPNRFAEGKHEPRWHAFLRQYRDLMQIVLLVAGILSLWPLKEAGTGLLLVLLTLFNAALGLHQEGKAAAAVAALSKMMIVQAKVRRSGQLTQVPAEELVPGDVVAVEAGDLIPADGRLITSATLEVDESALTGESVPVSKDASDVAAADTPLADRIGMVYMNTNVTRGTAAFVVTATGMATEVGHISGLLQGQADEKTPLTRQLDTLTNQILTVAGVALVASISLNLARGGTFKEVFTAGVAFAVAAVPTGLPAVVTAILSMGTQVLARAGAIMKQLRSTETLGSTSAINSDKTGTLTLNQMTAVRMALVGRRYSISGEGYGADGKILQVGGETDTPLVPFLLPMALASDAVVSDGKLIGDPTEGALVALAEKGGLDTVETRREYPRVATLPFDAAYKLMATFHQMDDDKGDTVIRAYVKGAPDQLLARASGYLNERRQRIPVDEAARKLYLAENQELGKRGLRVMATAFRDFPAEGFDANGELLTLMTDLTLLTLVGIVDPPRAQARGAIETAKSAGIRVRMITGDHAVTAAAIAEQLGIDGRAITGAEFSAMTDEQAQAALPEIGVIARVTPEDKVRLVDLLKRDGAIVAMTGDGVNDAPALKRADIGIAMGITGTEVSKEAAVMILTDDNFATIVRAVEIGRGLYDNLTKYIRFQMGCLFGFIVSFLGASIFNIADGVPFLPLQTLYVNFTVQVAQAIGLGYGTPAPGLMERTPRDPNEPVLSRWLLAWLIGIGLVMGVGTLSVISWATSAHDHVVARTMGLTTFAIGNLFLSFEARDARRTVFSLDVFSDRTFLLTTGISVAAIYLATAFSPFQSFLKTTHLDMAQWLICIGVAAFVIAAAEIQKLVEQRMSRREAGPSSLGDRPTSLSRAA
jgi:Ca2+-transporting ATPase